jgi:hypothetical protein
MIFLQIPSGHGACGHEGRFVRREEIAVKVRSLMRGVAGREVRARIRYETV